MSVFETIKGIFSQFGISPIISEEEEIVNGQESQILCAQRIKEENDKPKSLLQIIITLSAGEKIDTRIEGIDVERGYIQTDDEDLGVEFWDCTLPQTKVLIGFFAGAWA